MCRRAFRNFARITVSAATVVAVLGVMAPAEAAQPKVAYLEASTYPSVYGDATLTFANETRVEPIRMYVKDRACDSSTVYVRFLVFHSGGGWATQERRNGGGCGTSTEWNGLYVHDARGIVGMQLMACVDSTGNDECAYSEIARNPYLPYSETLLAALVGVAHAAGPAGLPGPDGVVAVEGVL